MPNWVFNSIYIDGEKSGELLDILTATHPLGEGREISFLNLIQPPEEHWSEYDCGSVSFSEQKKNPYNWYDWNIENWGTKWDACDSELDKREGGFGWKFQTAWSPPDPVIKVIINLCVERQLSLSYFFEEEQGWGGTVELEANGEGTSTWWDIPEYDEEGEEIRPPIKTATLADWTAETELEQAMSRISLEQLDTYFGSN